MKLKIILSLLVALALPVNISYAQEQKPQSELMDEMVERLKFRAPQVSINQIPSLFFTSAEAALIASVRNGIITRPPTERELDTGETKQSPEAGVRELSLGGIVYKSSSNWTIWINGKKITPKRIPPEILDIKVRKDHVKIRWFDPFTNQIFPIKLKPHQRFNIDTRIFLPG